MAVDQNPANDPQESTWLILLPLLIVLSTFLLLLLLFLICLLLIRRRRGIVLRDSDGPVDMSREELIESDGGFETMETRWLEGLTDDVARRAYMRAKDYQLQYLPNSLPTDITLSQFLSIQEKGVSAWSFEPDFETVNSLLVHARTEITFLPDPASASCVQSNLPLPKLNEVYYWEVKMFDLPESTNVAIGLATKPYPSFRLPGFNRYSIAYHSNGDKSHNYPFTAQNFGSPLKEGDVLGVGYRPRSGTVFFTRNGRKMEDAFTGLNRWNLFPTIGADGPCSVHVNLGQAGFVFVEANVKKWGLAPSVGTLAPPPAYGSERGSILLDVGGRRRSSRDRSPSGTPGTSSPTSSRRTHRSRRPRLNNGDPIVSSPLRTAEPITPPPPITPIDEEPGGGSNVSTSPRYISPTDLPFHAPPNTNLPLSPGPHNGFDSDDDYSSVASTSRPSSPDAAGAETYIQALTRSDHRRTGSSGSQTPSSETLGDGNRLNSSESLSRRDPPAYSPLDAFTYADGVHIDLPAEVISAALEGNTLPASVIGHGNDSRSSGRRSRRR
ncbi:concanavalin A-like lectin/glucanase domain-containing protein [Lentinula raphanica]|nr:concanavalin A-like lectin/glucanase domain-containing protein [Lentinula raphanica]